MTNKDFIEKLAQCSDLDKVQIKRLLECAESVVIDELRIGGSVSFPGVGKIQVKDRPERMVRNPATGMQFKKEADKAVKITIAKSLKDAVNQ